MSTELKYYLEYLRRANMMVIEGYNSTGLLYLDKNSGNFGIGTSGLTVKFTVSGDTLMHGAYTGSTVLELRGSQGQLFTVTDSLTGVIFSVNDISGTPLFTIDSNGDAVLIGEFYASVKHFKIPHPIIEDKYLVYSSLESPFNGVQLKGQEVIYSNSLRINLPNYLNKLIYDDVNIQITPFKNYANYFISSINISENYFEVSIKDYDNKRYEFFWVLIGERKDINRLQVEQG
jgi:hypothetical protein